MKAFIAALALSCTAMPAGAADFIIDGTHTKDVKFDGFDFEIPFTMVIVQGTSPASFSVSFDGFITADPRFCSGFPPGEEPADCNAPIDEIFAEDWFTASSGYSSASLFLPFFLSGTGKGRMHFSATDGATVHISMASGTPAPEPGTWAMMVGGFGLVGAAMRSRRKIAAAG